ncbi:MAG TPA: DUF5777 family beta-barrel protein [Bacteroidales bacterium]|nr:DUF5777 family beta-barrel protein [Bacteroidales bacterium]
MHTTTLDIMKRWVLGSIFLFCSTGMVVAQDSIPEQPEQKPLEKASFESSYFIADQTVTLPPAKTLELVIQHDFGTLQKKWSDLWGIWGSSNIRFGLNYTITKDLQIGVGTTKFKRMQDLSLKYVIARQRKGGFPVNITFFGDVALDCRNKSFLGNNKLSGDLDYGSLVKDSAFRANIQGQLVQNDTLYGMNYLTYNQATGLTGANQSDLQSLFNETFKASYRFSYFAEIMFSRRFCKEFSAQLGISWVHYNLVDQAEMDYNHANGMKHDNINISGIGRIKISPQTSIMLSYSQPVFTYLNTTPWPNAGLGVEISTSTHAFQIFVTSANGLVPQETVMYNYNNPYNGFILFGFNITRLWTF